MGISNHEASGSNAVADAGSLQSEFTERLHELMARKCVTQEELSRRMGCSQPAISQLLNRKCRPQKKTIVRLADALHISPRELWPDIEVAERLDAVAAFEEDGRVMTPEEAAAIRDRTRRNAPKIPVQPLPVRRR
jgi:transcriptional regulator with XRE-family HTH domain